MFIIIKNIKQENGLALPVIVLDSNDEILEFSNEDEAMKLADIFNANSHSGRNNYEVKRI
jgi:hypothetical protein